MTDHDAEFEAASDNPVVGGEAAEKMKKIRERAEKGVYGSIDEDRLWLLNQLEAERALVLTCYDQIRDVRARLEAAETAIEQRTKSQG